MRKIKINLRNDFWNEDDLDTWKDRYSRITMFFAMLALGNVLYFILRQQNWYMAFYASIPILMFWMINTTEKRYHEWKNLKPINYRNHKQKR